MRVHACAQVPNTESNRTLGISVKVALLNLSKMREVAPERVEALSEMHHRRCQASLWCVFFFCSNQLSIHPSVSVIPSHSLSVFHHSISKPDPRVNSVPPPSWTEPITTCPDGISKMQLFDLLLAELCTMHNARGVGSSWKQHGCIGLTLFDPFLTSFVSL